MINRIWIKPLLTSSPLITTSEILLLLFLFGRNIFIKTGSLVLESSPDTASYSPNRVIILSMLLQNPLHNNQLLPQRGLRLQRENKLLKEINSQEMKVLFLCTWRQERRNPEAVTQMLSILYPLYSLSGPDRLLARLLCPLILSSGGAWEQLESFNKLAERPRPSFKTS